MVVFYGIWNASVAIESQICVDIDMYIYFLNLKFEHLWLLHNTNTPSYSTILYIHISLDFAVVVGLFSTGHQNEN